MISNMQAMVAIQMRIGMAHPVVTRRVPNGPALIAEIVMEMNRFHSTEVEAHATSWFNKCIPKFKRDQHLTHAAPKARKVG